MLAGMKPELLDAAAIQHSLARLPGWEVAGKELVREFKFTSYLAGVEFVQQVAHMAEALNHHPDLLVRWRKVEVRLSTHSAGGLTGLDFELARQIASLTPPH